MSVCDSLSPFKKKTILDMAFVRHLEFVMTSSVYSCTVSCCTEPRSRWQAVSNFGLYNSLKHVLQRLIWNAVAAKNAKTGARYQDVAEVIGCRQLMVHDDTKLTYATYIRNETERAVMLFTRSMSGCDGGSCTSFLCSLRDRNTFLSSLHCLAVASGVYPPYEQWRNSPHPNSPCLLPPLPSVMPSTFSFPSSLLLSTLPFPILAPYLVESESGHVDTTPEK